MTKLVSILTNLHLRTSISFFFFKKTPINNMIFRSMCLHERDVLSISWLYLIFYILWNELTVFDIQKASACLCRESQEWGKLRLEPGSLTMAFIKNVPDRRVKVTICCHKLCIYFQPSLLSCLHMLYSTFSIDTVNIFSDLPRF